MFRKALLPLLFLLLVLPGNLAAVDFSGLDLDPMIRVRTQQTTLALPPAPGDIHDDLTYFVTRGGATVFVNVIQLIGSQTRSTIHQLGRGIGSPAPLTRLKQALSAARAGTQRSCSFDQPHSPLDTFEITWYGKNARQNQFTVAFGPPGATALPPCPAAVSELIAAIVDYEIQVLNDPASEVLTNE